MSTAKAHNTLAILVQAYYEKESGLKIALAVKTQEVCMKKAQAQETGLDITTYFLPQAVRELHRLQARLQRLRLSTRNQLTNFADKAKEEDKSTFDPIVKYYIGEIDLALWEADNDVADLGTSTVSSAVSTLDPAEEVNTNALPVEDTAPAVIHRRAPPEVLQLILADDRRNHGWRWWYHYIGDGLNGSMEFITYCFLLQSIAYAMWRMCHFLTHVLGPGPCPYADYYVLGGLRRNDTAPLCWIV